MNKTRKNTTVANHAVLKGGLARRSLLQRVPLAAAAALSLESIATPTALAQQSKLSHMLAKYQDAPKNGQQCSTCSHFAEPSSCAIVVDPIAPLGWCQFFVAKSS
jgi:hypothetical protein